MARSLRLTGGLRSRVTPRGPSETDLKTHTTRRVRWKSLQFPPPPPQPLNSRVLADDMEQTEPQLQMGFDWPARTGMYVNSSGWLDDGGDNVRLFWPFVEQSHRFSTHVIISIVIWIFFLDHTIISRDWVLVDWNPALRSKKDVSWVRRHFTNTAAPSWRILHCNTKLYVNDRTLAERALKHQKSSLTSGWCSVLEILSPWCGEAAFKDHLWSQSSGSKINK